MAHDPARLHEQALELQRKRAMLESLEEKLAAWRVELGPQDLPAEKRQALEALARESISTLQAMIERLAAELPVDPRRNGSLPPTDQPRG